MDYRKQFEKNARDISATGQAMEWHSSTMVASMIYVEWLENRLKEVEGWVSVEDRLPEEKPHTQGFLGYHKDWGIRITFFYQGRFDTIGASDFDTIGASDNTRCTHWKPLPAPPEEENK